MPETASASRAPLFGVLFFVVGLVAVAGFALMGRLPAVATEHGPGIDGVINYLLITTGILLLLGNLVLGRFVMLYSKGLPQPGALVSERTQLRWAVWPILIMCTVSEVGVLVMGLPVFGQIYGEPDDDAFHVEVVGQQFEWIVRYPGPDGKFGEVDHDKVHKDLNPLGLVKSDPAAKDDIVVRGNVHVPVGRMTVVQLRSLDVLHSFTVPLFRTKQDLIPGFTAYTQFTVTEQGEFELACAELCGLGHYRMQGKVIAQSEEDLEQWLAEQEPWL
jgi:cytochrome c oxidase subunit II